MNTKIKIFFLAVAVTCVSVQEADAQTYRTNMSGNTSHYVVTTTNPDMPNKKQDQFGLHLGIGATTIYDHLGTGVSVGARWLRNYSDNVGWNVLDFITMGSFIDGVILESVQLATGLHLSFDAFYVDCGVGLGFALAFGGDVGAIDAGVVADVGLGVYLTKGLHIGGFFNRQTLIYGGGFNHFGLRLGWDF